jgi:hypothetical protein
MTALSIQPTVLLSAPPLEMKRILPPSFTSFDRSAIVLKSVV